MVKLELNVEKKFEKKLEGKKILKRFKVYPRNGEYMDLEDAEQVYEYLVKKKKIKEKDILINGLFINGYINMKNYNDSEFNMERTQEYFSNRVLDVEKFTDDIMSLDVYIKVPN